MFGINSSYTDGSGRAIVNTVSYTQYWANSTNAPTGTTSVSDAQMIAMLQSGFAGGALTYDANTVYAIFTSGKVNLGGGFGTQYCAYHADKCAWTWGTTYTTAAGGTANMNLGGKDFLVQQNWKNSGTDGCALHL